MIALMAATPVAAFAMTCSDLFGRAIPESDQFRQLLIHDYRTHLTEVRKQKDALTSQFLENFEASHAKLLPETWKVLEFTFDPAEMAKRTPLRQKRLEIAAQKKVARDDYFVWLTQRKQIRKGFQFLKEGVYVMTDGGPQAMRNSFDPTELLFSTLETDGPSHLSPRLSLIRVIRDLDPGIDTNLASLGVLALQMNKIEVILTQRVLPLLEKNESRPGVSEAWALSPNLSMARENLRKILSDLVKKHGTTFSKTSFEVAHRMIATVDSDLMVLHEVGRLMTDRSLNAKTMAPLQPRLAKLKEHLRIAADFDVLRLSEVMALIQMSQTSGDESYETFLLDAFADARTQGTVLYLEEIITLGETMSEPTENKINERLYGNDINPYFWY